MACPREEDIKLLGYIIIGVIVAIILSVGICLGAWIF